MKILVDMNLAPIWATFLAEHEIQAVHWSEVGDPKATDAAIMEWARVNDYVVFTHDLDFSAILASSGDKGPSVIQVRAQDVLPDALGGDLLRLLTDHGPALERGAIATVDKVTSRVRILPLHRNPQE